MFLCLLELSLDLHDMEVWKAELQVSSKIHIHWFFNQKHPLFTIVKDFTESIKGINHLTLRDGNHSALSEQVLCNHPCP